MQKQYKLWSYALFMLALLIGVKAQAQPNCTNHTNSNGQTSVTFNVENTNSSAIVITDMQAALSGSGSGSYNWELLYNTTPISSSGSTWTQGTIGNGQNGWVLGGSATGVASSSTVGTVLSGLTITIPGNTTYGFCLSTSGTLAYQSLGTGVNSFSSNGVNLITGDNISFGGGVSPGGSGTPQFYPRGIVGCINWMTSVPCSGTPTAGTSVVSPSANMCPNQSFTVSLSGATVAAGLTYDWQYNDGTGWQPTGGTNASYSTTMTATAPVDYRCIVSCGSAADTSTPVTVTPNGFLSCYCSPLNGTILSQSGTYDNYISNVTIVGTNLNNTTTTYNSNGYEQFIPPTASQTDTLWPGVTYTIDVTKAYNYQEVGAWIDWDQSGTLDASELISFTFNSNVPTVSATFTVPLTATPGPTGFRVRANEWTVPYSATVGACSNDYYGEAEDYVITVGALTNCSGAPNHATATGPAAVCANTAFTVAATGMTIGLGITYDWQYNDGSGWQSTGGTSTTYTETSGITMPMDYRLITYCGASNMYDTSSVVSVAMSPFYNCVCTSSATSIYDGEIFNVSIGSLNNSSTCNQTGTTGSVMNQYSDYTNIGPDTLYHDAPYNLSVQAGSCGGSYNVWVKVYMDLDHDGAFTTAGEEVFSGTTPSGNYDPNGNEYATGSILIPSATFPLTGTTRMRVVMVETSSASSVSPCGTYGYGETEDYLIYVATPPLCAGTPNHATASGPSSICPSTDFTLSASGVAIGVGITYDWQYNDGSGWFTTGITSPFYTVTGGITLPTDYRMITYCGASNMYDTSNVVSVAVSGFYACYCSPLNGVSLSQSGTYTNYISNVTIVGTNLNNTTTTYNSNGYEQFIPPTASQTDTLWPGVTYTIDVTKGYNYQEVGAWIDWDQSGTLDATELISFTFNSSTATVSATFTVPLTATPGMTGLRVRANEWTVPYSATVGACDNDYYGEAEDYVITVGALTSCTGAPNHATVTAPANACPNIAFTVTATGMSIGLGITYDWQYNDGSGWFSTGGNSTNYTVTTGITVPTDYRMITYCGTSNMYDTSTVVSIGVNDFYACYCSPLTGTILSQNYVTNYISNVTIPSTTLNSSSSSSPIGYQQFIPSTTTTTASLLAGVTYTINVTKTYSYEEVGAWIDYDQSGTLDASEFIPFVFNSSTNMVSATFTVPVTATPGATGLRVRANEWTIPYSATVGACDNDYYGEAEDYMITILPPPTCIPPTALNTPSVTANTATVDWTQNSSATQWQIEYGPAPLTLGTGTRVTTSTKPYIISGLNPVTNYEYYVRDICAVGDTSLWSSGTFTTACAAITTFPWIYDVESQPTNGGSVGQMTGCWTATPVPAYVYSWWVSGSGTTPSSGTGPSAANSGTHFFYTEASYGSSGNTAVLESPQFDITSLTTPQLQFAYHMYGASINKLVVEVNNGAGWVPMDSIIGQQQTSNAAAWQNKIVPLTGLTGVIEFRLVATKGSSFDGDISIDDLMIMDAPLCPQPSSLTLSNYTASGVDVSWTGTGSNFILEYGPFGYTPGTGATAGTGGTLVAPATSPYTISGLASGQYSVYVREDCSSASNGYSVNSGNSFWTLPANDSCAGAIAIPAPTGSGSATYSYNGATTDVLPVTCGSTTSGMYYGLWYTITTGTSTGSVTATLCNSTGITGDTYMRIYDGTCGSFTCVNYSDDYCGALSEVTFTAAASTTYYILVSSYGSTMPTGTFTLDVSGTPLAIKLDKISATNVGKANRIDWNSLDEAKGDKFELQRSADGRNFEAIAYIQAKGTASHYTYMDNAPYNGINYYRLLMKDAGGKAEYSKVVTATVDVKGGFAVNAYPNPVSHDLTVQVSGVQGADATVQITDVTGKVINTIKMTGNVETINMSSLANGIYLIKYSDADHTQTIRVNKQ